jgi:RimJ/RimL family protein N-acetyltransferase
MVLTVPDFSFEIQQNSQRAFPLREQYLNEIPYAQEYYLELQIMEARLYLIKHGRASIGYFYLSENDCLLEFFVTSEWIDQSDKLFGEILDQFTVRKALCKSFDATMLSCCFTFQKSSKVIGILFRDYKEKPPIHPPSNLSVRNAVPEDEAGIIAVNEEVFDHPSEVIQYIRANQLFIYEKNGEFVGFGIHSPVYPGRPERDIGMLVAPGFRKMGYGLSIIQHLVNFCHQNNWKPSAGCAIENTASRKCLESSGFIARFHLLEFTF